jgi:hypothetical protein
MIFGRVVIALVIVLVIVWLIGAVMRDRTRR